MIKTAVFPGSFDPFTIGHNSIVERAIPLFDKIIIAIGYNESKQGFFPVEKRKLWIEKIFANQKSVEVQIYNGLTIDFCIKNQAGFILRGLRTSSDFEYERAIAQVNKIMHNTLETVFLLTLPEHTAISSSIVREVIKYKGDVSKLLPKIIADDLNKENS